MRQAFGVEFHLVDVESGHIVRQSRRQPVNQNGNWIELCREVSHRSRAEFIDEADPLLVLAVPLGKLPDNEELKTSLRNETDTQCDLVAVATFLSRSIDDAEDLSQAADMLGFYTDDIANWTRFQTPWSPKLLSRAAQQFAERLYDRREIERLNKACQADQRRIENLIEESQSLSENLSSTYEEISLLHRLTQHLKISEGDQHLGQMALEWLEEVVPAEVLALALLPIDTGEDTPAQQARSEPLLLTHGESPVDVEQLLRLVEHLGLEASSRPFVANRPVTGNDAWPCPEIRQTVIVPLAEGDNVFGWLAAINHVDGNQPNDDQIGIGEFGSVEASLLSSVGAILGIHSGNIELYRQQAEMFSGVVRALTSAIDAKDRYTRGHSDRVARIAVRLASEIGCSEETLKNIYLAGLLHDIGKIGIDDHVLRKPGQLSEEEYEHIKSHVEVGHRILFDLKQMDEVLPVVLYHHEAWDGGGYPHHLLCDKIPLTARIVAVADAYDAMSSDRPYRKGMPEERIDKIFRKGSGKQWDPQVVKAFFSAREDIYKITDHQ
ncbi:MAG: HD-GYP domain-containing protein [Pirellulales bacterium]|nr:HD-GYP domain-containing protein [Pirellulales bacterium]